MLPIFPIFYYNPIFRILASEQDEVLPIFPKRFFTLSDLSTSGRTKCCPKAGSAGHLASVIVLFPILD